MALSHVVLIDNRPLREVHFSRSHDILRCQTLPADQINPLLLLIRLELLLHRELVLRPVGVHEYPQVSVRRYHLYRLRYLIRVLPEVSSRLVHVPCHLLQVVLDEIDLRVIVVLDGVQNGPKRGIQGVNREV